MVVADVSRMDGNVPNPDRAPNFRSLVDKVGLRYRSWLAAVDSHCDVVAASI